MEQPESESVRASEGVLFGEGSAGGAGRSFSYRKGLRPWSAVVLSVLLSAGAALAAGCFCALTYPILRGKRAASSLFNIKLFGVRFNFGCL